MLAASAPGFFAPLRASLPLRDLNLAPDPSFGLLFLPLEARRFVAILPRSVELLAAYTLLSGGMNEYCRK